MEIKGSKKYLYFKYILSNFLLETHIETYVEIFGGNFGLHKYFNERPPKLVYNDIKKYPIDIDADIVTYKDYSEILSIYDNSIDTLIFCDPPYYGKEDYYGMDKFDVDFHYRFKKEISKIKKAKVIISYDNSDFIKNLYRDNLIIESEHPLFKNQVIIKINFS